MFEQVTSPKFGPAYARTGPGLGARTPEALGYSATRAAGAEMDQGRLHPLRHPPLPASRFHPLAAQAGLLTKPQRTPHVSNDGDVTSQLWRVQGSRRGHVAAHASRARPPCRPQGAHLRRCDGSNPPARPTTS